MTEKRFFTKNSFNFRLELSTRILKAILTTTVLFSYHSYATCLPQQCYFLTTAVVRLLISIKRDSFRRYRAKVVDTYDLNIVSLHCSAEYETSDTSESINTYFNHFV